MTGHKGVAITFRRLGKTGNATQGAQRLHSLIAPSQNLMGVALMPHIKHQTVLTGVEHTMDRHNNLHRAQAGGQMASSARHSINQPGPQQFTQRGRLTVAQSAQIIRDMIQIKNANTSRPVLKPGFSLT